MPDLFEQLKQKYQPVLDVIPKEGAELQNLNLDGNQLFLRPRLYLRQARIGSGTPSNGWTRIFPI